MNIDLTRIPAFGVAGNFTGHLEQAGEAVDFLNVKVAEPTAPKALFPTYIPVSDGQGVSKISKLVPTFLKIFPFDSSKIVFPKGEEKLQIEPECAVVFDVEWNVGQVASLRPVCFGASNDCSIRKAGARKISEKKNWGASSKGFSDRQIELTSFRAGCELDGYRIASFLVRDGKALEYGEDSPVSGYSYIWEKLERWLIDRLNFQKDEGPAEDVGSYLAAAERPARILISIGATRYTEFGEKNFLRKGDQAVVILYPESAYTHEQIVRKLEEQKQDNIEERDICILRQIVDC
ncbi:MAG: hypothetical protein IJU95_05915 [Treponema sp.]|nr:hypothetical protein [Treponema sp.]